MKKLLIVEDDKNLNYGLAMAFEENFHVISTFLLEEARQSYPYSDLVFLDLNLPDGDGLDFIREIRRKSQVPILVLSARDMELDIVLGIEAGADDYITKPFSLAILKAKVGRIMDRVSVDKGHTYCKEGFSFDFQRSFYEYKGQEIKLTWTEEKILSLLIRAKGRVVSRQVLLEEVWYGEGDFIDKNTLSVNVNRLRSKLGQVDPIETIYGVGYRWKC